MSLNMSWHLLGAGWSGEGKCKDVKVGRKSSSMGVPEN